MSSKPVVALALSRATHDIMFTPHDLARLREAATVIGPPECGTAEHLRPLLKSATVAITGWGTDHIGADLLEHAPNLKLIAHSAGTVKTLVDNAAYDRGVRVTNSAAANAEPVAETTVAMMVVLLKRIPWLLPAHGDRAAIKSGPVRELRDMDVGLIGASHVGREVIRLLKSYPRLHVKVYDPFLTEPDARELGVEIAPLDEVCRCE